MQATTVENAGVHRNVSLRCYASLEQLEDEALQLEAIWRHLDDLGVTKFGPLSKHFINRSMPTLSGDECTGRDLSIRNKNEDAFIENITDALNLYFDNHGLSLPNRLLKCRVMGVAMAKLRYGENSAIYLRAKMEMANTYNMFGICTQAKNHVSALRPLLDSYIQYFDDTMELPIIDEQHTNNIAALEELLEHFYSTQNDETGGGMIEPCTLINDFSSWNLKMPQIDFLVTIFLELDGTKHDQSHSGRSIHWQKLLHRLHTCSISFQTFVNEIEAKLPKDFNEFLSGIFCSSSSSSDDIIDTESLLFAVQTHEKEQEESDCCMSLLSEALIDRLRTSRLDSISLVETLIAVDSLHRCKRNEVKLIEGQFKIAEAKILLSEEHYEDAIRNIEIAITLQEDPARNESCRLVDSMVLVSKAYISAYQEKLSIARQEAEEQAQQWIQTSEGKDQVQSRILKAKQNGDEHTEYSLLLNDFEAQIHSELVQEYASLAYVAPSDELIQKALASSLRVCEASLLSQGRTGHEEVKVHRLLAEIDQLREKYASAVDHDMRALEALRTNKEFTAPLEVSIQLHIANLYRKLDKHQSARNMYIQAGKGFCAIASEVTDRNLTLHRYCFAQAIESFRSAYELFSYPEGERILVWIYRASLKGYGICSTEAYRAAEKLGNFYIRIGKLSTAENLLQEAAETLCLLCGPQDRRYQQLMRDIRKLQTQREEMDLISQSDVRNFGLYK